MWHCWKTNMWMLHLNWDLGNLGNFTYYCKILSDSVNYIISVCVLLSALLKTVVVSIMTNKSVEQ